MIELYPHNKRAVDAVNAAFQTQQRAAVVHATGTGKSYIIAAVAENYENVLIVAPNNFVLDETRKICHKGCEYRTYSSIMFDEGEANKYDLIVLDEFHRGGADKWNEGVRSLIKVNKDARLLGTSATNIRYLDRQRDMADEMFDGNVVSYLPLRQAIEEGILPNPIYVSGMYSMEDTISAREKMFTELCKSDEEANKMRKKLNMIANSWENACGVPVIMRKYLNHDMQRIIVFCSKIKKISKAKDLLNQWLGSAGFKKIKFYNIDYQRKHVEREMEDFQQPLGDYDLKVALSINMLNEGIHVPHVDCVIMLRSTISRIILEQQIGRCLTADNSNIKPVVLDLVNNMDSISYDNIVINSRDHYKEREYKEDDEYFDFPFNIIDECRDIRIMLQHLDNEIFGNYTKEECKAEAQKYGTRNQFQINAKKHYYCAKKNGWLDEIKPSDKKFLNRVTDEEALNIARQYNSRKDLRAEHPNIYGYFVNNKKLHLLNEIIKPLHIYWSNEMLAEEAKKYKTRGDFKRSSSSAYKAASKRNILDDICEHMGHRNNGHKWTVEEIEDCVKQCKDKIEWYRKFNRSYKSAARKGIVEELYKKYNL